MNAPTLIFFGLLGIYAGTYAQTSNNNLPFMPSFNSTPFEVFTSTNNNDTNWQSITTDAFTFGPTNNASSFLAWGVQIDSNSDLITGIIKRTVNTTFASLVNDSNPEISIPSTDTVIQLSTSYWMDLKLETSHDALFIACVGTDQNEYIQIFVTLVNSSALTVQITTNPSDDMYNILDARHQDGVLYVLYSDAPTYYVTDIWMQAVDITSGALIWSTPAHMFTHIGAVDAPFGSIVGSILFSNYTNSTKVYAAYIFTESANGNQPTLYYGSVRISTGIPIPTENAMGIRLIANQNPDTANTWDTYLLIGGFESAHGWGFAVAIQSNPATTATSTSPTYSLGIFFNGTSILTPYIMNDTVSDQYLPLSLSGSNFGSGGYIIFLEYKSGAFLSSKYVTQTLPTNYAYQAFFTNGTKNGTSQMIGAFYAPTSKFQSVDGTYWFGYTAYNVSNYSLLTSWCGNLIDQKNFASVSFSSTFTIFLTFIASFLFIV